MNDSGLAVAALARRYGVEPEQIVIVHDELDLPVGALKVKTGGGLAGPQRAALDQGAPALRRLPARAHRGRASRCRRSRASTTCCKKFSKRERTEIDVTHRAGRRRGRVHRHRRRRRRHEPLQLTSAVDAVASVRSSGATWHRAARPPSASRRPPPMTCRPRPSPPSPRSSPRSRRCAPVIARAAGGGGARRRAGAVRRRAGRRHHAPAARCSRCRRAPRPSASCATSAQFLGADGEVELFPAWETLPFERVSPSLETMGRRLRVLWRLRVGGTPPAVVVAPVRALVQRLGPHVEEVEPVVVRPGDQRRPRRAGRAARRAAATGASTRWRRAARSRCAARSSTCTRRPTTTRCASTSGATRSTGSRRSRSPTSAPPTTSTRRGSSRRASCSPPTRCASAPPRSCATQPWGREQWERLADGQVFDGMESWLPWLTEREHLLPDLLPDTALALLVEPKRMRDRAQELLDEEAVARGDARGHVGRGRRRASSRASRSTSTGCSRTPGAGAVSVLATPEGPDTPRVAATAFDPVVGDTDALGAPAARARGRGLPRRARRRGHRFRATAARRARGRGPRRARRRARAGAIARRRAARTRGRAAGRAARARRRGRPHRSSARAPPRARRASRRRLLRRRSSPATTSCTTCTASAATSR